MNIVQTPNASIPKLTLPLGNGLQCFMDGRSLPAPCPASSKQSLCGIRKDREGGPLFILKGFVSLWMEKGKNGNLTMSMGLDLWTYENSQTLSTAAVFSFFKFLLFIKLRTQVRSHNFVTREMWAARKSTKRYVASAQELRKNLP